MAKYRVLSPIEHDGVLFLPADPDVTLPTRAPTSGSAGTGMEVSIDRSGEIELSDAQAARLTHGQIPLHQSEPDPVGGAEYRAKKAADEAAAAAAKAKEESEKQAAFQEWWEKQKAKKK